MAATKFNLAQNLVCVVVWMDTTRFARTAGAIVMTMLLGHTELSIATF